MTLTARDRRALVILVAATAVTVTINYFLTREPAVEARTAVRSAVIEEKRLEKLRRIAATVPGKEEALEAVEAELARREKGLIQADTAAQAQAQLLEVFRRLARAQAPAIEIKTVEMGQVRPLGQDYGEILVPVTFDCRIEQLLNLLADITAQPEAISTSELRVTTADQKEKTMTVRLTLAGVAPRRLASEKKGRGA